MIDLIILTDNERREELIRRYWRLDSSGSDFKEPMKELKEEFGLSRGAILGIVRSGSRAFSKIHKCDCGTRKEFRSRKDLRSTPKQKPYECEECKESRSQGAENEAQSMLNSKAEENVLEDLFADVQLEKSLNDSLSQNGQNGREAALGESLRSLARELSKASQRLERLSHQMTRS